MSLHVCTPYRADKNLGKAYNEAMARIPDGDWACLIDYDVCFLLPDTIQHIEEYIRLLPKAGLLTCYTNRIGPLSTRQMHGGTISYNADIRDHIQIAEQHRQQLYQHNVINADISGFLMVISKATWQKHPFPETGKALGVDTQYGRLLRNNGKQIIRMNGIYVWHTYRMAKGIKDKTHLQ